MATVLPLDKGTRAHRVSAWILIGFAIYLLRTILDESPHSRTVILLRFVSTFVLPSLTFFIVAYRNISFERAVAMRCILPTSEFRSFMKYRPMLNASDATATMQGILGLSTVVNIDCFDGQSPAIRVVYWTVQIVGTILIAIVTGLMAISILEDGHKTAAKAKDGQRLLEDLKVGSTWKIIGVNSEKRVQAFARRVDEMEGDVEKKSEGARRGIYDLAVMLDPDHERYRPYGPGEVVGQVLRITL